MLIVFFKNNSDYQETFKNRSRAFDNKGILKIHKGITSGAAGKT